MPRKAKEKDIENEIIEEKEKKAVKKTTTSKEKKAKNESNVANSTSKNTVNKKTSTRKKAESAVEEKTNTTEKKTTSSKKKAEVSSEKKATSSKKKAEISSEKKATSSKKKSESTSEKKATSSKKKSESASEKKTTSSKKKSESASEKKATSSKKKSESTSEKKATSSKKKSESTSEKKATSSRKRKTVSKKSTKNEINTSVAPIQVLEYYDLPYKYGNTLVKLLAQTPKTLFVYWEVSDLDIKNFKEQYGEDFFNVTKPILIVHNLTLNKIIEVEINDFANCWYLNTEDSDCKFDIELARKFINQPMRNDYNSENNYLVIAKSNKLQVPNDHILFEKLGEFITFKNTKTGEIINKHIKSFSFIKDLYEFYQDMYNDNILKNPSSNFNI